MSEKKIYTFWLFKPVQPIFLFLVLSVSVSKANVYNKNSGMKTIVEVSAEEISKNNFMELKNTVLNSKKNMSDRWNAAIKIGVQRLDGSKEFILSLIQRPEWFLRNAALVVIQSEYPELSKEKALFLLKDKALVVRSAAVEVLLKSIESKKDNQLTASDRQLLWKELDADYNFRGTQSLWVRDQIAELLAINPLKAEKEMFAKYISTPNKNEKNSLQAIALSALKKIQ